jgi:hypothetical protein
MNLGNELADRVTLSPLSHIDAMSDLDQPVGHALKINNIITKMGSGSSKQSAVDHSDFDDGDNNQGTDQYKAEMTKGQSNILVSILYVGGCPVSTYVEKRTRRESD